LQTCPSMQHQFSPNLIGHMRYTFTTSNGSGLSAGAGSSESRSHRITTELGYQLDTETSAILRGCPETSRHHYASIKQPPCGNEKQADYMERACSA